ncbi:MAG: hypothetical protein COA99_05765, partial [Moraxellaceae bacterium]
MNMFAAKNAVGFKGYAIRAMVFWGLVGTVNLNAKSAAIDIHHMEIEQLMELPVYSVNKRSSSLAESAAAVYVITSDAIRRSGAKLLPEVLALAPGVDVVKTNTSTWGVGIRGFNGQYSNKLLVLVDGRSIYSVVTGSVLWDVALPLLDDIDRVEVIRGPGASLWGSNAVNGVINIITKSSEYTQGQHIVIGVGDETKIYSRLRSGGELANNLNYRVYGQAFDQDGAVDAETGHSAEDDYQAFQIGVRLDWQVNKQGSVSVQNEWFHLNKSYNPYIDELIANDAPADGYDENIHGGHVMTHWSQGISEQQQIDLQLSIDKVTRDESTLSLDVMNVDLDFQHTTDITNNQQFTWGVSYRYSEDDFRGKYFVDFVDAAKCYDRTTAFLQDEIAFTEDWAVILGVKLEETEFAALDAQPTLRLLWTPSPTLTGWAAFSKANRTPTRVGRGVNLRFGSSDDFPSVERFILGSKEFESERLYAYETGFRTQFTPALFVDASAFYFEYQGLRTFDINWDPNVGGMAFVYENDANGYSFGGELVMEWRPLRDLSLNLQYSYFDFVAAPESHVKGGGAGVSVFEQQEVHNIAAFRCEYNLSGDIELDWSLSHRGGMDLDNIKPHTDLDIRVGWRY